MNCLDRPVWSALTTGWAPRAIGGLQAKRIDPALGPFATAADPSPESLAALAALLPAAGELWLVEPEPEPPLPPKLVVRRRAALAQMVLMDEARAGGVALEHQPLGAADAAEMRALAQLTKPGPWLAETWRYGGFIGVREGGQLIAMASERMQLPGYAEVSGVCTHHGQRGRGLAGALMRIVAASIRSRGLNPFLHSYDDNAGADALYEALGYHRQAIVYLTVIGR